MSKSNNRYPLLEGIREAALKKFAESDIHKRLTIHLEREANSRGFSRSYTYLGDGKPDVVRESDSGDLFIGDAKVGENEDPGRLDTLDRILGYLVSSIEVVVINAVLCTFIIATDDRKAAKKWHRSLNAILSVFQDIGFSINTEYQLNMLDAKTYLVECRISS